MPHEGHGLSNTTQNVQGGRPSPSCVPKPRGSGVKRTATKSGTARRTPQTTRPTRVRPRKAAGVSSSVDFTTCWGKVRESSRSHRPSQDRSRCWHDLPSCEHARRFAPAYQIARDPLLAARSPHLDGILRNSSTRSPSTPWSADRSGSFASLLRTPFFAFFVALSSAAGGHRDTTRRSVHCSPISRTPPADPLPPASPPAAGCRWRDPSRGRRRRSCPRYARPPWPPRSAWG
jgi:hypothetical protein